MMRAESSTWPTEELPAIARAILSSEGVRIMAAKFDVKED
jgi:hypothetical protein